MSDLTDNQKHMVAEMLRRTNSVEDMDDNIQRILGNAYGDKKTADVYKKLALLKLARYRK